MQLRNFIALLLFGAVTWPLVAHSQQSALPVIGFLNGGIPNGYGDLHTAFSKGVREAGYIEGQNVTMEYYWAEGHDERLPA